MRRRDVVEATRAAAKYFTDAYRSLESWPLAITSYNHGIAGVRRKVNQMGTRDISRIIEHPTVRLLVLLQITSILSFWRLCIFTTTRNCSFQNLVCLKVFT
jgi:hypothetical protein